MPAFKENNPGTAVRYSCKDSCCFNACRSVNVKTLTARGVAARDGHWAPSPRARSHAVAHAVSGTAHPPLGSSRSRLRARSGRRPTTKGTQLRQHTASTFYISCPKNGQVGQQYKSLEWGGGYPDLLVVSEHEPTEMRMFPARLWQTRVDANIITLFYRCLLRNVWSSTGVARCSWSDCGRCVRAAPYRVEVRRNV